MTANDTDLKAEDTDNVRKLSRVLVVDDDRAVRETFQNLLEPMGYLLDIASDGIGGIECFYEHPVDLVLLDLNMPAMNGVEFLRHLRKMDSKVPVIIVTGYPHGRLMSDAMQYGPIFLLPKPFGTHQLLGTVESVINHPVHDRR